MKTKIIYISGNEVFEMAQIRAAFDEVRSTLGLDKDTILFGVPIDSDNALSVPEATENAVATVAETVIEDTFDEIPQEPEIIIEEPAPMAEVMVAADPEPAVVDEEEPITEPEHDIAEEEKVIPILSVLSAKEDAENADDVSAVTTVEPEPEISEPMATAVAADKKNEDVAPVATQDAPAMTDIEQTIIATVDEPLDAEPTDGAVISGINIDTVLVAPVADGDADVIAEPATISDMIRDEAPVAPVNTTLGLEDLLESMKPLREDIVIDAATIETDDAPIEEWQQEDTDATLAQLASEFAENEDKIVDTAKTETHGKIGKLKSILPFKKRTRDDNFPTDNLFGWAGVAANDEDFSIPGFFTPVSSKKKQGA